MNWNDKGWGTAALDYHEMLQRVRPQSLLVGGLLPQLNIDGDPVTIAKELAILITLHRDILLNGYTPVRVVCEEGQDPHAIELTPEGVRAYASEICQFITKRKGGKPSLKTDIANIYLQGLEGQWGLQPLRGISTSPILSADGSIRIADGYDEETGLWCHSIPAVEIPERPTKDDAQQALLVLRQAFWTFPFSDAATVFDGTLRVNVVDLSQPPNLDESTHLVALMTAVCRPCLPLAPGFLYDAPGFSRPAIFLDNFNEGVLQSATLASFLTESPARVRVLGQSKTVLLNTCAFVAITGNAVQIAEDIARRILKICLDAKMENPEQRPFAGGFLPSIFDRRVDLLTACLTIWRWGVEQRDLKRGLPLGSYEQWAQWCRDSLLALGCRDPVERVSQIKAADPKRRYVVEVFQRWWKHHADKDVTAADLHLEVKEAIDPNSKRTADDVLAFSRQRVASFLRAHINTRLGGFVLTEGLGTTNEQRNRVTTYRLMQEPTP